MTFIILYNNLIPISLIVTMEVVKYQQAQLINSDLDMYYVKTDTPALCRTSSLVEELGQIEYVFSDKTGTLTRNEMEFRFCSIGGVAYADVVDESHRGDGDDDKEAWRSFDELRAMVGGAENPFVDVAADGPVESEREVANEFLTLLAVCHTVIPEVRDGKMHYQASSPDEAALVAGAEILGYQFHVGVLSCERCRLFADLLARACRCGSRNLSLSTCTARHRSTRSSTYVSSTQRGNGCRRSCAARTGRSSSSARARIRLSSSA